jgi:Gpi18-like mannosyltransferase
MVLGVLERLTFFDGGWYAAITAHGYSYAPDGRQHDVAFFPLYPSVVWCFMRLGLSFTAASLFVSGAAFLAALFITFAWVRRRCDVAAARWTIAMLCCCPLSLFCSAAYSDALFLLVDGFGAARLRCRTVSCRYALGWIGLDRSLPG